MSDMKCPVCNVGYVHESVGHWCCDYEHCPSYNETSAETYDVLIITRKALDVAVERLKNIVLDVEISATPEYLADRAKETLEQINKIKGGK